VSQFEIWPQFEEYLRLRVSRELYVPLARFHLVICEPIPWGETRLEHHMKSLILTFFKNESGATAIEYGLIAAGIALAIIAAVQGVGTQLSANFGSISTSLK
jgi:pilus assembly protein Flp/PilA